MSSPGPNFCLLPAGSSHEAIYPKIEFWIHAIRALQAEFPGARFFVTGKSVHDDRSATLAYSPTELAALLAASANVVDCYDLGLWNQLALLASCQVLVAPHTGLAFLASCVGTPWLAVSGVRWPECFFNDAPFYSVLPACTHDPCRQDMKPECASRLQTGETVLCMDELLPSRTDDLIAGARLLLDPDFSFAQAAQLYQRRIDQMGSARERFFQIT